MIPRYRLMLVSLAATLLATHSLAFCANIDPSSDEHRYSYGENIGWFNYLPQDGSGVTVMDKALTGFVWSESVGWIKLDPVYGGVSHDGKGNLAGYGWSENVGWINFSCENTGTCDTVDFGVKIDGKNGIFSGYAWGENVGWIRFDYSGFTCLLYTS